ncbi:helix-turn-helix domain-containing protein [Geodermatophilus sp. URMC 63]
MTADDQRYTLREAADLINESVDTLRRWVEDGRLPGAGKDPGDPTGTIYIPASALFAAGLLTAEQVADGEPEAVIARRRAERERDADHDELLTLRAEEAALHREIELLREDVAHLRKVNAGLVASLGNGRAA